MHNDTGVGLHREGPVNRRHHVDWWDLLIALMLSSTALWLRWPALNPPSLWADDAWQALAIKVGSEASVTSPGFAFLLGLLPSDLDMETALQLPALIAGVGLPAVLYLGARWLGWWRAACLATASTLVGAEVFVTQSTRVKPFMIDALIAMVFLLLVLRVVNSAPPRKALSASWVVAAVGVWVSGHTVILYGSVLTVLVIGLIRESHRRRWPLIAALLGSWASYISYYFLLLRPRISPALASFWEGSYLDSSSPGSLAGSLASILGRVSVGLFPVPRLIPRADASSGGWRYVLAGSLVLTAMCAAYFLLLKKRRTTGLLLLAPILVAIAAAGARAVPLGTGRTDAYLAPALLLTLGAATNELWRARRPSAWIAPAGLTLAITPLVALIFFPTQAPYPHELVEPLVRAIDSPLADRTTLVLTSAAQYGFALYSDEPFDLIASPLNTTGFDVEFHSSDIHVVAASNGCRWTEELRTSSVSLLWASGGFDPSDHYSNCMTEAGFSQVRRVGRPADGATLGMFERRP